MFARRLGLSAPPGRPSSRPQAELRSLAPGPLPGRHSGDPGPARQSLQEKSPLELGMVSHP